ncbi:transglutaminase domain-containing protein, partial [Actinotalea sp. JY-7885]
ALAAVLVAASATAAGGALTRGEPFEPREHVTPPVVRVDATHPLPQLAVWAAEPDRELLVATGALPPRLSLVVLPDFDGATWRSGSSLRPVGAVASPSLPPGAEVGRMDATLELTGLASPALGTGTWLPTAGRPVSVTVPGALWDVETGSLVAPEGLAAGSVYRVTADVDQPAAATLATAGVPSGAEVARYLELPRIPADVLAYARTVTQHAPSRLVQARLIEETVRADRELAPDAVSGSSYARVREFLFAEPEQGGQVGTAEQFASSFAVLARAAGLPSRLVLGFVLPEPATDGSVVVRGEDAHVWPEVYLAGAGWVAFDPSPAASGTAADRATDALDLATDGELEPPDPAAVPAPEESGDAEPVPGPPDAVPGPRAALLVTMAVVAVLASVVVLAGVSAVLRARRLRRLRRHGAVGAWQHVEDVLVLAGVALPPGAD